MENVLQVYARPYDAAHPVICMDETTKQCVQETRTPQAAIPGHPPAKMPSTGATGWDT